MVSVTVRAPSRTYEVVVGAGLGVGVGVGPPPPPPPCVGVGVGVGESEGDGPPLGLGLGEGDGRGVGLGVGVGPAGPNEQVITGRFGALPVSITGLLGVGVGEPLATGADAEGFVIP